MPLDNAAKKQLRTIGHGLKPIIIIASNGLSETVRSEVDRALTDHELIKVSIKTTDRAELKRLCEAMCQSSGAELVQQIGHTALVYRPAANPNPRLSNLLRATSKTL